MNHSHETSAGWRRDRRFDLALLGFLVVAAFFLLSEHRAHALGALPFALLLLCPLLHVFMHRGHGGDDHSGHAAGRRREDPSDEERGWRND